MDAEATVGGPFRVHQIGEGDATSITVGCQ